MKDKKIKKHFATEARLDLLLNPHIEREVEVHVREQWADNLPLPRTSLALQQASVVDDSNVDALSYQPEGACVANPPLDQSP